MTRIRSSIAIIALGLLSFVCNPAVAINCPTAPAVVSKDIKVETEAQFATVGKLKGLELKNKTEVIAKNLLDKTPRSDRVYVAQMMSNIFCEVLSSSSTLTDKEKLAEFKDFQVRIERLILAPDQSQKKSEGATLSDSTRVAAIDPDAATVASLSKTTLDGNHYIALNISISLTNPADSDALKSLDSISLSFLSKNSENSIYRNVALRYMERERRLAGSTEINFRSQGAAPNTVKVGIGAKETSISLGDLAWKDYRAIALE